MLSAGLERVHFCVDRSTRFRALTYNKKKHVAVKADTQMPRILPIVRPKFHEALEEARMCEMEKPTQLLARPLTLKWKE